MLELDKLIKIEKGLLQFNGHLPNFLYRPIKALKWEKFFMGETKVRLYIINMFYAAKYQPDDSYAIVKGEKVPFTTKKINELYGLPNDSDACPGKKLIANPREGDVKRIIQLIAWLGGIGQECQLGDFNSFYII